jgi:hypothetical protein
MHYEITFPRAAGMLEQERKSTARPFGSQGPRHGHYVEDVSAEIMRDYWLTECGGQRTVDAVLAVLDRLTNTEGYAKYALAEASRQWYAARPGSMRRDIDVTLAYDKCPRHRDTWMREPEGSSIHYARGSRWCPECAKTETWRDSLHRPI